MHSRLVRGAVRTLVSGLLMTDLAGGSTAQADTLDQNKKALDMIADFAERLCKDVAARGGTTSVEVDGDVKARLGGLVRRLADLGVQGAVKYKTDKYERVLQRDVAAVMKDNTECRLQVLNHLRGTLLQTGSKTPGSGLSVNVSLAPIDRSWRQRSLMTVEYELIRTSTFASISPTAGHFDLVKLGGPIRATDDWWSWDHPDLDIKVVNNTGETVFISEGVLEITRSHPDPTPVLFIRSDSARQDALRLRISNAGWRPVRNVQLSFNLRSRESQPTFSPPYEHTVTVPDFVDYASVDVSSAFTKAGVNTAALAALRVLRTRQGDEVIRLHPGSELDKMPIAEFKALLGPFATGAGLVSGIISYDSQDLDGTLRRKELAFAAEVWLFNLIDYTQPSASPALVSYHYIMWPSLDVEGKGYKRRINMSQQLKPGEVDRFTLKLRVDKSSVHTFTLRLIYNGSKVLDAGEFRVNVFVPNRGFGGLGTSPGTRVGFQCESKPGMWTDCETLEGEWKSKRH